MKNWLLFLFLFLSFFWVFSQRHNDKMIKIKGTVTDAEGFPIKNGSVFIDSLKTGYKTNQKGVFKLRIPPETDLISIHSKEYGMQSVVYTGGEEITIKFRKDNEVISESELSKLGYILDVSVFRNIGEKSYSEYTDIFQIIREKFTGVTVSGSRIYVRGYIGGDQTPLFIVDGTYVPDISFINPDELQSIELLKGEDTALYGSRGAPGVFIISLRN